MANTGVLPFVRGVDFTQNDFSVSSHPPATSGFHWFTPPLIVCPKPHLDWAAGWSVDRRQSGRRVHIIYYIRDVVACGSVDCNDCGAVFMSLNRDKKKNTQQRQCLFIADNEHYTSVPSICLANNSGDVLVPPPRMRGANVS